MDERENEARELLPDELEYLQLKNDFFDDQTDICCNLIYNQELKDLEDVKEEQELLDKFNERGVVKEKLISHLKALKHQVNKRKKVKKDGTVFININGFFNCPECQYKTKRNVYLKLHINTVHFKIKAWKCLECSKGLSI